MDRRVTLVEFLAPVRSHRRQDIVLAVLYYNKHYLDSNQLTVGQVKTALLGARMPKVANGNISDALSKSAYYVDIDTKQSKRLWTLTISGDRFIQKLLNLPSAALEVKNNIDSLNRLSIKISDSNTKDLAEEAINCLQAGLLRAAVVFLWSGVILSLRQKTKAKGFRNINYSIRKYDSNAHSVTRTDDFCYIKDSTFLLMLQDLGILDKGQRETLEEALRLRNRCGHPTKYRPGSAKVSSFIEDTLGIAF